MTTTSLGEVVRGRRVRTRPTCASLLLDDVREALEQITGIRWPNGIYQKDPVGFCRNILGQEPWEKQCEILEATRDYDRVSTTSGHKCSKSHTAGMAAIWYYCSFEDARVVMSSTTSRQVDEILWREVRKLRARAGVCVDCKRAAVALTPAQRARLPVPCPHSALIGGKMGEVARSGLRADDFRQIVGFTAREPEAVAGVSGANILYIIDEASGVDDAIFEAIEGNRAGGAKILLFSNPTRTEGEFYESHHSKALQFEKDGTPILDASGKQKGFYKTIRVSSEETPNVRLGRRVIPGLATSEWIEEKRREWGPKSALYMVRVEGKFALAETGKIIALHLIGLAEQAHATASEDGRLFVGLDPAGPGEGGDETAFVVRRGMKMVALYTFSELDEDAIARELSLILRQHRRSREMPPVVVVDREGDVGAKVWAKLCAVSSAIKDDTKHFEIVGVRSSERSRSEGYPRVRDELWANLATWLRDGGGILEDTRLAKELHAPSWEAVPGNKVKATDKSELRSKLGRSPDRADALALSLWEGGDVRALLDDDGGADDGPDEPADVLDLDSPYNDVGTFDPYGGDP